MLDCAGNVLFWVFSALTFLKKSKFRATTKIPRYCRDSTIAESYVVYLYYLTWANDFILNTNAIDI